MGKFSFPNYECSVSFWTKIYMLLIGLSVYVVQVKIISTIYITVQDTLHKDKCTYLFINVFINRSSFFRITSWSCNYSRYYYDEM